MNAVRKWVVVEMKVLHIDTEISWGGGQNQLSLLLKGLNQVNVENYVAAKPRSKIAASMESVAKGVLLLPFLGELDLFSAFVLAQYVKKHRIEIISCHTGHAHTMGLIVKKLVPSIKLIIHRRVAFNVPRNFFSRRKYLSIRIDGYIAVCEAIRQNLIKYGVPKEKIDLIPSTIDESFFLALDDQSLKIELARQYQFDPNATIILSASRLTKEKGIETLLDACRRLKETSEKFHCLIVGKGDLQESLEKKASDWGLSKTVSFLGFRRDVVKIMQVADIFVLPSFMEGRGTSLLEALYTGCYLVGSNVGGIPEIIKNQNVGRLFPPGDAASLATTINQAIELRPSKEHLRELGREIAKDHSLEKSIQKHLELYKKVLDAKT